MRRAGLLVDVRSLPRGERPGDLRRNALRFIDTMADLGLSIWQVLPLNPVDSVGSPYASRSACAIDPSLHAALAGDFEAEQRDVLAALDQHEWLRRSAVFEALRDEHGAPWTAWPEEARWSGQDLSAPVDPERVLHHASVQLTLHRAWRELHHAASARRVVVVGDLPLYVAADSVDVWSAPHLFHLDEQGHPTQRAGVPPDIFSDTGQLWGNPVYNWDAHVAEGFAWWKQRVARLADLMDVVRIDHFIGVVRAWSIPAEAPDARTGAWIDAPGPALMAALDEVPVGFIAEDLGLVTPEVDALRNAHGLLGMAVHQFGFGAEPFSPHTPSMTPEDVVAYPGTHDNDTVLGWWNNAEETTRERAREAGVTDEHPHVDLIRLGLKSAARWYIAPLQDVLGLPSEARMNTPATVGPHNWTWRATPEQVTNEGLLWYAMAAHEAGRV